MRLRGRLELSGFPRCKEGSSLGSSVDSMRLAIVFEMGVIISELKEPNLDFYNYSTH